jgi:hypothetical protein
MLDKPYSQACENNKQPILEQLIRVFNNSTRILEIGSGTGQHAVFFAANLAHLNWYTSDRTDYHAGIKMWLQDNEVNNLYPPVAFTVGQDDWPMPDINGVFTANTTHIMQPAEAQLMMRLIANNLSDEGVFCQYGPFNFNGQYTSESNRAFDQHLSEQNCGGIRDIEELIEWAKPLKLIETIPMPANNFLLVWKK